jgi:hypothetical protein
VPAVPKVAEVLEELEFVVELPGLNETELEGEAAHE